MMGLKIIRAEDPIEVKTIVKLLYGQPGIGKSTAAFTADAPFMFDFDAGAHRTGNRKDSVRVSAWADVATVDPLVDLAGYKTVVIDTLGRALELLSAHLIRENPKLRGPAGLSLQGFGVLATAFRSWLAQFRGVMDVVLVAHEKEEKKGDTNIVRPDAPGQWRGEAFRIADQVGYMHMADGRRVIDFSPSDEWLGKDAGGLGQLVVPKTEQSPDLLAKTIASIKNRLNSMSDEARRLHGIYTEWAEDLESVNTAEELNSLIDAANQSDEHARETVKRMIMKRAADLPVTLNKSSKRFEAKE